MLHDHLTQVSELDVGNLAAHLIPGTAQMNWILRPRAQEDCTQYADKMMIRCM